MRRRRACSARWRTRATAVIAYFYAAALLAPAAFIFDVLDGRVARSRQQHSALGRELDSLADVISFGVAPAALAFAAGMTGGWDWIALIYFVCCGVSRLARFNVTAEAMSKDDAARSSTSRARRSRRAWCWWACSRSPHGRAASATNLYGGAWTLGPWTLHPLVLLYVLSGTLMISKTLRIPKL